MSARLLILTAGFGEGHNAAARALAAAADERYGPGTARVVDAFSLARPRTNAVVRRGYLSLINRAPTVWRSAYAWLDGSRRAPALFRWLGPERRVLARLIAAERPQALCSTYPLYAFLLQRSPLPIPLPPHYNVVTDSISINSLWWRAACARWFVPNEDSATVLVRAGVPADLVAPLGFPVLPSFAREQGRLCPPSLDRARPRVLYIINSRTRGAREIALRLLANNAWDVTCTVGHNEPLRVELELASSHRREPARILGWTPDIPRLLMTHHVVISKAGGATTQEAIAAHCPMIVNQIVPGQEEGNYELLRRNGIGALAPTAETVIGALEHAFADHASVWRRWRNSVARLARPNAARDIVAAVLEDATTQDPAGCGSGTDQR